MATQSEWSSARTRFKLGRGMATGSSEPGSTIISRIHEGLADVGVRYILGFVVDYAVAHCRLFRDGGIAFRRGEFGNSYSTMPSSLA